MEISLVSVEIELNGLRNRNLLYLFIMFGRQLLSSSVHSSKSAMISTPQRVFAAAAISISSVIPIVLSCSSNRADPFEAMLLVHCCCLQHRRTNLVFST